MKTDYNVRCTYKDGKWGEIRTCEDENITIDMAATCLHYGQEAFEGLKAFKEKTAEYAFSAWMKNAKRLQSSCEGIMMVKPPVKCSKKKPKVVKLNERFVPP